MNITPFYASYPNKALIASPESFFTDVSKEYLNFKKSGFFLKNEIPGIYIYEIKSNQQTYTGIITGNDISDYEKGKILGHENTIASKEQEMLQLTLLRKAMIKPVLLGYDSPPEIDSFIEDFKATENVFMEFSLPQVNEQHSVWLIRSNEKIKELKSLFNKHVPCAYIADGHHRTSTAVKLLKGNYLQDNPDQISILAAYFPFRDLKIFEYNRVVDVLAGITPTRFIALLSTYTDIKPMKNKRKASGKFEMTMFMRKEWFSLKWKKKIIQKFTQGHLLDVELFNYYILGKILKIDDVRTNAKIKYVDGTIGPDAIQNVVNSNDHLVGFCLYPVSVEEIKTVSSANEVLPPKSTWFEPRMKNGILVKEF
ncbi:MAG: DUF1015 domain-containing protein [Saprospiraceae bacterium]|nr:DUF1015 domain-containing protein [Saprospiraceae bacterium]